MEGKKNMGMKKSRPLKRIKENKIRKKKRFRINIRNIIPEIVEFLKSDSYFYAHLISSSAPSDFSSLHHDLLSTTGNPILGSKDSVKEKLVEYLKSDTYLYAPLEGTQHRDDSAVKTVISPPRGQELQFMRITSTVSSKKIAWQTKNVAEDYVAEKHRDHGPKGVPHDASVISPQTPALHEVKKQVARRSSRLSTLSG